MLGDGLVGRAEIADVRSVPGVLSTVEGQKEEHLVNAVRLPGVEEI
jgi:hypothetical protein